MGFAQADANVPTMAQARGISFLRRQWKCKWALCFCVILTQPYPHPESNYTPPPEPRRAPGPARGRGTRKTR